MKELIRIPPGLRSRIERLVEYYMKRFELSEEEARRTIEIAICQRGLTSLEQAKEAGAA